MTETPPKTTRGRGRLAAFAVAIAACFAGHAAAAHTRHAGHRQVASRHLAGHAQSLYASSGHHGHLVARDHLRYSAAQVRYAALHGRRGHVRYAEGRQRYAEYRPSGLQCVPYAREVSHIELTGDAFLWWAEASGRYARGDTPMQGAVLNFRPIGRMPLGHVAVVTAVIDSRTILVTQANWIRGTITNDVTVQDVSAENDWSAVQVELGDTDGQGATYPVYGFIYNQPDTGTEIASGASAASTELAEAPRAATIQTEAPDRNLQ